VRREITQLRSDVARLVGSGSDADEEIYWEAQRAAQDVYLRNPVTRKAILAHSEKYLCDTSPHKLVLKGMSTEQRIEAMDKAWTEDNPWPGFESLVEDFVNQLKTQGVITPPPRVGELSGVPAETAEEEEEGQLDSPRTEHEKNQ